MDKKDVSFYYFGRKLLAVSSRYERWRGVADLLQLKPHERLRVERVILRNTTAKENVAPHLLPFWNIKEDPL
jgi:hypothetical protein